jgi:hypothetical protein
MKSGAMQRRKRRPPAPRVVIWLACVLGLLRASGAWAGDPDLRWHSLETPHFRISYHDPLGRVAQRLAVIAERAHEKLAPVLAHSPRFRTEVLLTDDTDFSNGSATALPFPTVRLYLTAPDSRSELNDFDDWLTALFVHEYTHILHLDTVNGLPKWLNYLAGFGINTLYAPNQVQPRWFIEGLAVFEETERTSAGRLRSTLFDMYLRAHTLEGKFLRLDQVSNQTRLFPRGNVPYLYGSAFLRYIARQHGAEVLTKVSHRYGGCYSPDCWLPWGMSRALRRFTKTTYGPLYDGFRRDLAERYQAQKAAIVATPLGAQSPQPLSGWKVDVDRPLFDPDGRHLLWLESDPYRRPALMRHDLQTGRATVELLIDGASGLSLSRDGRLALMARLGYFRANFSFKDLVLYDRRAERLIALSSGLRVDHPDLSPDGSLACFEVNALGTRRLGIMALPRADERMPDASQADASQADASRVASGRAVTQAVLAPDINPRAVAVPEVWRARAAAPVSFPLPQDEFSQVYTPVFSPDGKHIAFSYWQRGGYRDIVVFDLKTRALRYVTHDRALDLEPRYSPDGAYLYFVSDRSGVYNVYAHHLATDTTWQVTDVVNGAFAPAPSPAGDRLALVGFVSEGYRIETLPLRPEHYVLAPSSIRERPSADEFLPPVDAAPVQAAPLPVKPYIPARTFFRTPLSLLAFELPISAPGPYGQSFGLRFATEDLVGNHSLSIGLTVNSGRADATGVFGRYTYGRLWNSLYIDFSRQLYPRGGLRLNGLSATYDEESITGALGTSLPILRDVARSATLSFSYSFSNWRNVSPPRIPGPDDLIPSQPEVGRYATLTASFAYSDARRFLYSVGPERGRYIGLSASFAHPALGSQYTVYSLRVTAVQYIGMPWPWWWAKNHTLSIGYDGGISGGDLRRRGYFYVGGFPTSEDFLRAALLGARPGQPRLRGYEPGAFYGDQMHVLNLEYRFPLLWIERGYETLPGFLWRLHGALYSDVGSAFFGPFSLDKLNASVGGELRLDGSLGYYLPFMLQLGYAHGFMDGADQRVYFLLNNPL